MMIEPSRWIPLAIILLHSKLPKFALAQMEARQAEVPFIETFNDQPFVNCTPCDGPIDTSRGFDGVSCSEWFNFAQLTEAGSSECALERILGWKFCGCPTSASTSATTNTKITCDLCPAGNDAIDKTLPLPFSSILCEAFLDVVPIDGQKSCDAARDVAYYCGCPDVTPQCTMCPDGKSPQHLDAPLYMGMTCLDLEDLYLVSSSESCGDLEYDYPFVSDKYN